MKRKFNVEIELDLTDEEFEYFKDQTPQLLELLKANIQFASLTNSNFTNCQTQLISPNTKLY